MKISRIDPKSICASGSLDDSRLGFHTQPVAHAALAQKKHGIVILGLADDTGIRNVGGRPGAKEGPLATRNKLYKFTTGAPGFPLYDIGDLQPATTIAETHAQATQLVREIAAAGHFPIVIGGGHDLGFPHALGLLEARPGSRFRFVNIDAHLDVRPTTHGITSGSPWFLLREHPLFAKSRSRIEEFGIQPHCNAHSLVSYAKVHKFGLHWLSDLRQKKRPMHQLFRSLLGGKTGQERLLVSLDIDSICFPEAPGCSAPQTLGFSASEAIQMSFCAGAHPRVESFGIFELSPLLDPDGRTAQLVAHCINACLAGFRVRSLTRSQESASRH